MIETGIMSLRDNLPKLLADAQAEENPELLERIAARLQDALADKVRHLRSLDPKAPTKISRKSKTAGS
jgi:hypothetical protein